MGNRGMDSNFFAGRPSRLCFNAEEAVFASRWSERPPKLGAIRVNRGAHSYTGGRGIFDACNWTWAHIINSDFFSLRRTIPTYFFDRNGKEFDQVNVVPQIGKQFVLFWCLL